MKNPGFPIVGDLYQKRITFAVHLSILDGFLVSISTAGHSGLVAGQGHPTVGLSLDQNSNSLVILIIAASSIIEPTTLFKYRLWMICIRQSKPENKYQGRRSATDYGLATGWTTLCLGPFTILRPRNSVSSVSAPFLPSKLPV